MTLRLENTPAYTGNGSSPIIGETPARTPEHEIGNKGNQDYANSYKTHLERKLSNSNSR